MTAYISLQRDRDTGRVYPDPHDRRRVRVKYTVSPRDRAGLLSGLLALARIVYAMGAEEIHTTHHGSLAAFVRSRALSRAENDAAFAAWLSRAAQLGVDPATATLIGSAHQMGTCRMSSDPRSGVVDSRGAVWTTKNLYVADASVFPSASGVNPMVTTMGLAEWICRGLVREMEGEK